MPAPLMPGPVMQSAPGAETVIDGRRYLYFAGTSYLGLAGHPEVIEAACAATRQYGIHTATSRSGYGNNPLTLAVEARVAEFFGLEAAFYFSSGYTANHILIQALAEPQRVVFVDQAAHFCVEEAARLSGRPVIRFAHRDPEDLERKLRQQLHAGQHPLVLSDGVFPTTGALAPVREYLDVLKPYAPAILAIDDAHALGVLGEQGRGTFEYLGLWKLGPNKVPTDSGVNLYFGGTLAKALGGFGGILPGARPFVQRACGASHYYDGASAPPSAAAGASLKALEIVRRDPDLRRRLQDNIRRLRQGLRTLGVPVEDGPAANIGVQIGDAANMQRLHRALKARGILVPYVAAYSEVGREGLLRVAVCASHTTAMIERLLEVLRVIL